MSDIRFDAIYGITRRGLALTVFQSHRTGFFTHPLSSNSGPIKVYTPSAAAVGIQKVNEIHKTMNSVRKKELPATQRSSATELWRWGLCAFFAGSSLRRDQRIWVSVFVSFSVALFPSRTPILFLCSAPGSCFIFSISAISLSFLNTVTLILCVVGATPEMIPSNKSIGRRGRGGGGSIREST